MEATAMILVALVGLGLVSDSLQFWSGTTCPNGWNKLTVKFMEFHDMPMTEDAAKDKGWSKLDSKPCNGHSYFVGNRYINKKREYGNLMLYDNNGILAGMQASLPTTVEVPRSFPEMFPVENGRHHLTAYFTNPAKICSGPKRKEGCVGENLYIQNGSNSSVLYKVPLQESGMRGTKWTKGKCFYLMGQHYWYNLSADMDCQSFFPVFLLYNGGKLNAFGWALGGDAQDSKFEHPKTSQLSWFFEPATQPKCLSDYSIRSTQHIYFQLSATKYFC